MNCVHCSGTGSLSKDLDGPLDCARCSVADERADLEAWAGRQRIPYGSESSIWLIYQRGKAAAAQNTPKPAAPAPTGEQG